MGVLGIGFDLVTISRFTTIYCGDGADGLLQIFSTEELVAVGEGVDRWDRLAARFAAKEATFKALERVPDGATPHDVSIVSADSGAPRLKVEGATAAHAKSLGIASWLVTLSHTDDVAGAVVCALRDQ